MFFLMTYLGCFLFFCRLTCVDSRFYSCWDFSSGRLSDRKLLLTWLTSAVLTSRGWFTLLTQLRKTSYLQLLLHVIAAIDTIVLDCAFTNMLGFLFQRGNIFFLGNFRKINKKICFNKKLKQKRSRCSLQRNIYSSSLVTKVREKPLYTYLLA